MAYVELGDFSPDLPTDTEGIIVDCAAFIPSRDGGYAGAPSPVAVSVAALEAPAIGAVSLTKLDGTFRTFAGTATKIFERTGATWTNQSKAPGTYTTATAWRFAQYGDVSLATNGIDPIQKSTSGVFADLGGTPPKAALIDTVLGFVVVADTNDTTFGDSPDRWWCSGIFNHETWAPSVATQAASNRLTEPPGPITASRRLGDDWIIYKDRGIYHGTYTGPPFIWEFRLVSDTVGALTQEGVINVGTAHIFVGYDGIYMYDGSRPQLITGNIHKWFLSRTKTDRPLKVNMSWDRRNSRIYMHYSSSGSTTGAMDECIVYDYARNRWGRDDRQAQVAFEHFGAGVTYDNLGSLVNTYDDFPDGMTYDGLFAATQYPDPAFFDGLNQLYVLNGASTSSSVDLWDMGDEVNQITLKRVRPRWTVKPPSATLVDLHRPSLGDAMISGPSVMLTASRFDYLLSDRWHRLMLSFSGDAGLHGVDIEAGRSGRF